MIMDDYGWLWMITLWLCQNSYWKLPFIVDFPINGYGSIPINTIAAIAVKDYNLLRYMIIYGKIRISINDYQWLSMIINDYLWSYIEIIDNHYISRLYMGHISGWIITTEPCSPKPWNHGLRIWEIIPIAGRKIQVSERLQFTQIYDYIWEITMIINDYIWNKFIHCWEICWSQWDDYMVYGEYFPESMTLWRFPRFPFCHGAPNHPVVTDETTMLMTGDLHDFWRSPMTWRWLVRMFSLFFSTSGQSGQLVFTKKKKVHRSPQIVALIFMAVSKSGGTFANMDISSMFSQNDEFQDGENDW